MDKDKPNTQFNFGEGTSFGGDLVHGDKNGEQYNAQGDQIIDKSQNVNNTVEGDVHGDFKGGDAIQGEKNELKELFDNLQKQVAEEHFPEDTDPQLVEDYGSPSNLLSVAYDEAVSDIDKDNPRGYGDETSTEVSSYTEEEFKEKEKTWTDRLKSLVPLSLKLAVGVGSAVVGTYVKKSPVVAGLKAAFSIIDSEIK